MDCKKTMVKKIKSIDVFGKPVMLNYNKKGQNFKTFLGGILSIILNLTVIAYGIQRIYVLNQKFSSNISSVK